MLTHGQQHIKPGWLNVVMDLWPAAVLQISGLPPAIARHEEGSGLPLSSGNFQSALLKWCLFQ